MLFGSLHCPYIVWLQRDSPMDKLHEIRRAIERLSLGECIELEVWIREIASVEDESPSRALRMGSRGKRGCCLSRNI